MSASWTPARITNVRPWGREAVDLRLEGGVIAAITPAGATGDGQSGLEGDRDAEALDGAGRLAFPTFADVHVHLDSTRLGLPFRPHTGAPGVWAMMMNDRENWRDAQWPIEQRTAHTLGMMVARGTTHVRSYAQIDADCRLERFEAVLAARQAHAGRCEVEVIAFPQAGLLREPGTVPLFEDALRNGAGVMGGIDPCTLDRDPAQHLDLVFGLAERFGVPVDFHIHEPGELGVFSVDLILERTRALSMQGRVTISHGYQLGGVNESTTRRLIESFAELDVSMATIAAPSDAALPLTALVDAGVRLGLGEDGQRDYWSPNGNADMLFRTWQLAFVNRFRADADFETALAVATLGGRSVMDAGAPRVARARPELSVGDSADLVLIDGETPTSTVMERTFDACLDSRTVLHRGRVVADAGVLT